ncbi:hypothetical protein [Streptomyces sp. DSM 40907]|uniref:hypothetical protein n=1 Tax=Streptomyces kutzneri TaxID=3051179 RepID=UPI0028D8BCCE|nr:hypothetical protein [Streptomyces sp. DSM 40907]
MDLEIRRHFFVDLAQDILEVGGPVPSVQRSDDLATRDFEGCTEGGGADVVVAAAHRVRRAPHVLGGR